jgi:phage-related protein (TIGR01555 family)
MSESSVEERSNEPESNNSEVKSNQNRSIRLDDIGSALQEIGKSAVAERNEFRDSTPPRMIRSFNQNQNESCMADKILKQIAWKLPSSATEKSWQLSLSDDYPEEKAESIQGDYRKYHHKLETRKKIRKALQYARCYGGAAIIMKIEDGRRYDQPVDCTKIKSISKLTVRHRFQIEPDTTSSSKNYKYSFVDLEDVEHYKLVNIDGYLRDEVNNNGEFKIHKDRILRFEGEALSDEWMLKYNRGWGLSIYDLTWRYFKMYKNALLACGELIRTHSTLQQSIEGLRQMMASSSSQGVEAIKQAAKLMRLMYDLYGMVLVDSKEQINWQARPVSGLSELVQLIKEPFQAASGLPHTMLWGESPSGMAQTGKDTRMNYAETVAEYQMEQIEPALIILDDLIFKAKDSPTKGKELLDYERNYPTIMRYNEDDKRQSRATDANTLSTLLTTQAIIPEELRTVIGHPDWWSELSLDDKLFEEKAAQAQGAYGAGGEQVPGGGDYSAMLAQLGQEQGGAEGNQAEGSYEVGGQEETQQNEVTRQTAKTKKQDSLIQMDNLTNPNDYIKSEERSDSSNNLSKNSIRFDFNISIGDPLLWKGDLNQYKIDYYQKHNTYIGCFL